MKAPIMLYLLLFSSAAYGQSSASYILEFDVFDSGGSGPVLSTSSSQRVHSIIGQAAQWNTSRSSGYVLSSGAECGFCDLIVTTGIDPSIIPSVMKLYQNYPNPFNPATSIRYVLERSAMMELAVFSLSGEKLQVLEAGQREAGEYEVEFDASPFSSGVFLYRLSTAHGVLTRRMVVMK